MKKKAFLMAALFVHGCTYAISPELVDRADKTIPFEQIETDPSLYRGSLVILGGTIVATASTDKNSVIEVENKPLDRWGKPLRTNRVGGHFLLRIGDRLNPSIYSKERTLTAAAVVDGRVSNGLSDPANSYPVLDSRELKLWPPERPAWERPHYIDPLYNRNPYASPRGGEWESVP